VRSILKLGGVVLVAVLAVMTVRAATLRSRQLHMAPAAPVDARLAESVAAALAEALRIPTVSTEAGPPAAADLEALQALLARSFPQAFAHLQRTPVEGHGLLLRWPGSDPALRPLVLLAHQDVVPVPDDDVSRWQHPPFSGAIDQGFVWGRGALDDKGSLVAILAAIDRLAAAGLAPRRTVILAFGDDEEIGGMDGAARLAAELGREGVHAEMVLDEGSAITQGIVPGIARPVALVAMAEKGFATVDLEVEGRGGHSSMPPAETAIGILARAVDRLERHPMPARLCPPERAMLAYLAPELGFDRRLLLANLWLTEPLVLRALSATPAGSASVRTSTAPTLLRAGVKDNVLAERASATVNFRILPGDTVAAVVEHVQRTIGDSRVKVILRRDLASEPSPVSPLDAEPFGLLQRTIAEVFPDAVVAPSLTPGATDARRFYGLSANVYRFTPVRLERADLERFHGRDERIAVAAVGEMVRFYERLITNAR